MIAGLENQISFGKEKDSKFGAAWVMEI